MKVCQYFDECTTVIYKWHCETEIVLIIKIKPEIDKQSDSELTFLVQKTLAKTDIMDIT